MDKDSKILNYIFMYFLNLALFRAHSVEKKNYIFRRMIRIYAIEFIRYLGSKSKVDN